MPSPSQPVEPIAFAGCGATSAVGRGVEALRSALHANVSGLRACGRFISPRFQSSIMGAAPGITADLDDPAWHLANQALLEAHGEASKVLAKIPSTRIGLILSTTKANIEAMERIVDGRPCSESARRHLRGDLLASDLAVTHGAHGPVQCVSVACASGIIAIAKGAKLIQRGAADAVLVVGVDHLSNFILAGFSSLKSIDPDGCRPFDQERRGLSPGEAGAAVVLVRQCSLEKPAVTLRGWGGSNDANHMTGPSRDGSGLAQAIYAALKMACLRPDEIDYVNAHGTGTNYNDAMEALALRSVFGENSPPLSGAKGMLGHTLGAAGIIETILCILAMREGLLPGTPRLNTIAKDAPERTLKEPRAVTRLNHILKLNTGFGGVNGALILNHG